jgi:peroxisomal trans-2-enoyl-CoA reductase
MQNRGGVIINIVADMWKGFPAMSHTGAARSAVDNLTKTLAIEWASCGIRINSIAPGIIFSATAEKNYENQGTFIFTKQSESIPAKRLGTVDEVSQSRVFFVGFLVFETAISFEKETIGKMYPV